MLRSGLVTDWHSERLGETADCRSEEGQGRIRPEDPGTLHVQRSKDTRFTPPPGEEPLRVTAAEVRRTLQRINPRKAAGPDNISGRVLKGCAYQLTEVLTDIFNTSLQQAAVPTCLKTATIIPIPKTPQ
ncbi:hypothetical protein L3Q82_015377 [Scortum barcoo]|uniref:Uncharacterized protein n=1 Tax=Scortum barcoo TaxID=214431 RepID=A0ACB8VU17_9TELE|nr:hypothetical protein L3Q82_015377 [Scortum barcoo]